MVNDPIDPLEELSPYEKQLLDSPPKNLTEDERHLRRKIQNRLAAFSSRVRKKSQLSTLAETTDELQGRLSERESTIRLLRIQCNEMLCLLQRAGAFLDHSQNNPHVQPHQVDFYQPSLPDYTPDSFMSLNRFKFKDHVVSGVNFTTTLASQNGLHHFELQTASQSHKTHKQSATAAKRANVKVTAAATVAAAAPTITSQLEQQQAQRSRPTMRSMKNDLVKPEVNTDSDSSATGNPKRRLDKPIDDYNNGRNKQQRVHGWGNNYGQQQQQQQQVIGQIGLAAPLGNHLSHNGQVIMAQPLQPNQVQMMPPMMPQSLQIPVKMPLPQISPDRNVHPSSDSDGGNLSDGGSNNSSKSFGFQNKIISNPQPLQQQHMMQQYSPQQLHSHGSQYATPTMAPVFAANGGHANMPAHSAFPHLTSFTLPSTTTTPPLQPFNQQKPTSNGQQSFQQFGMPQNNTNVPPSHMSAHNNTNVSNNTLTLQTPQSNLTAVLYQNPQAIAPQMYPMCATTATARVQVNNQTQQQQQQQQQQPMTMCGIPQTAMIQQQQQQQPQAMFMVPQQQSIMQRR
jgi:hypothetical protein